MVTDGLITLGEKIMSILYALIGVLPTVSPDITNAVNQVFQLMYDGVGMLCLVCHFTVFKTIAGLTIMIIGFDVSAKIIMWIVKKIPIVDIK